MTLIMLKNYSKTMWQLINSSIGRKIKNGLDIPNYFEENNEIYNNYKEIANRFKKFFYSYWADIPG